MRLYIAGPMTGKKDFNYPAFNKAEKELRNAGFDVANPTNNFPGETPGDRSWREYVSAGIIQMLQCDGVAALGGSHTSRGAILEIFIAQHIYIPVHSWRHWIIVKSEEANPDD